MRTRRLLSALLIVTGLALCGVAARHYVRGWQAQAQGKRQLAGGGRLENPGVERASDRLGLDSDDIPHSGAIPLDYPYGEPIARLKVPIARIDAVVFAGADQDTLEKGPGHVPGTEMPGAAGPLNNCVITGHRDSHFRRLGWLTAGTEIELDAPPGNRRYRVVSREIVKPDAVRVLEPSASPRLTLITCYPFNYIGPAPRRLVVVAVPVPK